MRENGVLRVSVDARQVYRSHRRGTGKNLIDLYRRVACLRPSWTFVMFREETGVDDPFADLPSVQPCTVRMRGHRWDLWQQVRLPIAAWFAGANVMHCPANTAPRFPLVPLVVTIHDLIPLEPASGAVVDKAWVNNVGQAARKADQVITPSDYSKARIVQHFAVDPAKVTVNYWAPDGKCDKVTDPLELSRVCAKYNLDITQPYVFGFAAADPRKNTVRILEAWAGLSNDLRSRYALLLVGVQEEALAGFRLKAKALGLSESCIHGFADEADLPALFSGATLLCYPSLAEGFGLPILDAFSCETAVVTSSTSSLPEVAGDAAVLVDPADTLAIRTALEQLLCSEQMREELVAWGKQRVKEFTWDRCAECFCRVLEKAAGVQQGWRTAR
jgi:glycosyltransferase involved in cell wall biosynthesis